MTEETQSRSGCWKFAAFGCLAVVGLALVSSLAIGGLVFSGLRADDQWVERNSTFSEASASSVNEARQVAATTDTATESQLSDARTGTAIPTDNTLWTAQTGSLELDLAGASFELRAHDGQTIQIENDFDEDSYRLSQETTVEDDGSEHTTISFRPRAKLQFQNTGGKRLTILVPRTRLFALRGEVKQGESDLDIGGLALSEVDLEMAMGDHRVSVSEPTAGLMERFSVRGSMGALRVDDLGNASPYGVEVTHRMGEVRLNLDGDWRNDAAISLRCRMGQCTADVPVDVRAEVDASAFMGGKNVSFLDSDDLPADAMTLHLRARATMGEVEVR